MIQLDTHVVAWLFAGRLDLLSAHAKSMIERESLAISPMVILELKYLFEIGRTTQPGETVVGDLRDRIDLVTAETPFTSVIRCAEQVNWTRDPFDRVIVGHAIAENVPLLTKDNAIRAHYSAAVWE